MAAERRKLQTIFFCYEHMGNFYLQNLWKNYDKSLKVWRGSVLHIHKVTEPDYPFVWDPWWAFVRHMEMSTVWFLRNTNISIFSWQLEIPHCKPRRKQKDKGTDMHICTNTLLPLLPLVVNVIIEVAQKIKIKSVEPHFGLCPYSLCYN